jgi:two-component system CheB/CheR fusion protein
LPVSALSATRDEVRDLVVFAQHSLLRDPPFSRIDLISCRNLLIYLDRSLQNQACSTFHYALRPHGYPFLGSSESIEHSPHCVPAPNAM